MPNKLKGYRVMAGYNQKEMAEALGIKTSSYNAKELGKTNISIAESKKLYEFIKKKLPNVNFEDIFF